MCICSPTAAYSFITTTITPRARLGCLSPLHILLPRPPGGWGMWRQGFLLRAILGPLPRSPHVREERFPDSFSAPAVIARSFRLFGHVKWESFCSADGCRPPVSCCSRGAQWTFTNFWPCSNFRKMCRTFYHLSTLTYSITWALEKSECGHRLQIPFYRDKVSFSPT